MRCYPQSELSGPVGIHRAYLQGANAYLLKPANPGDLVDVVKTIKDYCLTQNRMPKLSWSLVDASSLRGGV